LVSQQGGYLLVNFVYSRILIFWWQWGQPVPGLACWTCVSFSLIDSLKMTIWCQNM